MCKNLCWTSVYVRTIFITHGINSQGLPGQKPLLVLRLLRGRWHAGICGRTRQTDHKAAQKICSLWEKAGHTARRHELTAAAGRKVIAEMVAISSGESFGVPFCRGLDTELA